MTTENKTTNQANRASDLSAASGSDPVYPQAVECNDGINRWTENKGGMTLRQHYAGLAMAAYIQSDGIAQQYTDEVIASLSLKAADALCSEISEQNH